MERRQPSNPNPVEVTRHNARLTNPPGRTHMAPCTPNAEIEPEFHLQVRGSLSPKYAVHKHRSTAEAHTVCSMIAAI